MKITTEDLRRVFNRLIDHLEGTGQNLTELPWDFYWEIAKEDLYEPYSEPKQLSIGQLSDDWDELLKIANGRMPPVGYALVWLSSILRAVGESAKL
jgi:hypothetical protein